MPADTPSGGARTGHPFRRRPSIAAPPGSPKPAPADASAPPKPAPADASAPPKPAPADASAPPKPAPATALAPRRPRRPLPWLALGAAAVPVLLLLAAWIGPGLLDWNAWRPAIAEVAAARLGRPVALGGRISLALLPQPRIEAAEVTLGHAGDGVRIDARALRLRLDLPALIAGRLEPREIAILGGDIRLPWPPEDLPSFRPPAWLGAFDARLEDCRVTLGGATVEGVNARLVTGGALDALVADGRFTWRGQPVRFNATLGRAGFDGAAPLDVGMAAVNATLSARGILAAGGGFEGRMEVAGTDLSALVPAPPVAFRAAGRLTATEELIAGIDLGIELGGQPARGAVSLRLVPAPRLDIALTTGRLDLDAWIAAARQGTNAAGARAIPVGIDLSAEATALGPLPVRRLRGAFYLDGDRLTLSDVSGVLPGGMAVELAGATAGPRLELAARFATPNLRETLAAVGVPLDAIADPARLRQAEGRVRLALQEGQASLSDLVMDIDGSRITGNGVVRPGARPMVGLGLTLDRLDLDGLLPAAPDWAALPARLGSFDLNLRLAAEQVKWAAAGAAPLRRAALDASLENGRLALRRLGVRLAELDIGLTGSAVLASGAGAGPMRVSDLALEVGGAADAAVLGVLLPPSWPGRLALPEQMPVALRLFGGGAPEALALRAEGDLGELRIDAQGTLDLTGAKGTAALTLRHPGAPRLLGPLLDEDREALAGWLGQGSFALIAGLGAGSQGVTLDKVDLVAGGLRARGDLALALADARPRLTGRLRAERLPLPELSEAGPLAWARLGGLDAEVALAAERVEVGGTPALEEVEARVVLGAGALALEGLRARLGGGALEAGLSVGFGDGATPPRLALEAKLADAAIGAPLFGLPLDLGAGRLGLSARVTAEGHGRAGIAATLAGTVEVAVKDGQLAGYDLAAVQAAAQQPGFAAADAALRGVLAEAGGGTAFESLTAAARIADGVVTLERATLATEGGAAAAAEGRIDLARGMLDLLLTTAPVAEAPPVGLRVSGPVRAPRRLPELAAFLRWKATH